MTKINLEIGLEKYLDQKCINRSDLAKKLNVSRQTVHNYFSKSGGNNYPSFTSLIKICKVLDVSVSEFVASSEF